jgi:[methyl-Co(III) methanol-specific corrinoid protein]:coenzyme M methyltransferase
MFEVRRSPSTGCSTASTPAACRPSSICGKLEQVRHLLPRLAADAISTDALVNLKQPKAEYPQLTTMGNVSTFLLGIMPGQGCPSGVANWCATGSTSSPACG